MDRFLQDNLQQIANFILEKNKECKFIIPKFLINRDDTSAITEKILNITL